MKAGADRDLNRQEILPGYARKYGADGLEPCLISAGPKLENDLLHFQVEAYRHNCARHQTDWKNYNIENTSRYLKSAIPYGPTYGSI